MNIGIFSGSFNPIHRTFGPRQLSLRIRGPGRSVVYGHPHNPLKEENELMDDKLRLKLVQLATEGYPKFRASDFEFHLPRPSYTVHTLDALKRTYPNTLSILSLVRTTGGCSTVGTSRNALLPKIIFWFIPSRLSGRGCPFTAECADSFFSGIRNQLHFYPSGHRGGKRRTLLPASGCVR